MLALAAVVPETKGVPAKTTAPLPPPASRQARNLKVWSSPGTSRDAKEPDIRPCERAGIARASVSSPYRHLVEVNQSSPPNAQLSDIQKQLPPPRARQRPLALAKRPAWPAGS